MIKNNDLSKLTNYILLVALVLNILIIGTGLHEIDVMPKDEYIISILSLILLLASYYYSNNIHFIEPKILLGYFLFNAFFIFRISILQFEELEVKTYFIHLISLGSFLAIYTATKQLLSPKRTQAPTKNSSFILPLIFIALAILLFNQLWESYTNTDYLIVRFGGYLNPNLTASIALIFLFTVVKLSFPERITPTLIALTLSTTIIFITQSRATILVLIPFCIYLFVMHNNKKHSFTFILLLTIPLFLLFILPGSGFLDIIQSALTRFGGDHNSNTRLFILQKGLSAFTEAPIWGNGYRHLESTFALSAHNEIVENLANFGLTGLIFICAAFYLLYFSFTLMFFILCILPTLLFSHNFFDSYSFQAVLGFALAIDRHRNI